MSEPFDVYSDNFTITVTPWGANLTFSLGEAHPTPTVVNQPTRLGTVRMSNEHVKAMAFILTRQMLRHEETNGVQYALPTAVLSQLGIAPEDWDSFWHRTRG
jgi:hypothetical protein